MKKKKGTLKDQVYQNIYDDIIAGYYSEEDIITEGSLIEKYQVSKSPVREALIQLCSENVLMLIEKKLDLVWMAESRVYSGVFPVWDIR